MAMDASDVAISLVICSSLHVLSVEKFLSSGKHARIKKAINHLQNILNTSRLLESSTNDGQQSCDCRPRLLDQARHAVDMADKLLLEASRHLKSRKGPLAKIRTLVHFMSPRICIMALDFVTTVEDLSTHPSQMQDLSQDPLNLDKTAALRNVHRGSVRWDRKVESDIVGREDEVNKLLAQLIGKDGYSDVLSLRVISVVGEEAIGKTALVRSVYNRLEIDHSFQCRIWVHVPEEFTMKDLLVEIMEQIAVQELKDLVHYGEEKIKEIIYKSLVELRYLIVFDNLREVKDMDEFMIFLADSKRGSRVIVTTRIPEIPSLIDPWAYPVKLNELADGGARLLRECSSIADNPRLKARILSKCSGSPLRILLLGGLVAASGDSSAAMVDQLADNPTLRAIVSLSYHKLPSLLKPCLLYLCLFPKESAISIRRLFRLWHAEGWVQASPFTAEECFEELAGRNLVQVVRHRKVGGRPKLCRVSSFL
ncbi:putative disease resistance RPP13-like protein 3 [Eucalyptus grandis]|uniref:putative disease resistance RPP13-like protein 3 n=1 Tax=Eucalyptus grandis TaxID=71139 RepID=UPI00192EB4D9|nr:putative disease resistance RPP13-like protein 3 [Eucalyptus grandis]